jgi:hypothetical protein
LTKRQPSVVLGQLARAALEALLGLQHHEWRAAHRLDAAGQEQVALARADRAGRLVQRLEARCAKAVDGRARCLDGQPREQSRHARDVAVLLAGAVGVAEVDVVDPRRVDARALDDRGDRARGQVVRPDAGEHAAVAADRGADSIQNQGFRHRAIVRRVQCAWTARSSSASC